MAQLPNLLEAVSRWRQSRRDERAALDAEAQALIADKSRDGALWVLRERIQLAHNDAKTRRRLLALQDAVIRLAPRAYRADTATRMLYRES